MENEQYTPKQIIYRSTYLERCFSEGRSSDLVTTDAKYSWNTQTLSEDESHVFTLGWKDTGDTDGTDFKHTKALQHLLRVAHSLDLNSHVTTADFNLKQADDAFCN